MKLRTRGIYRMIFIDSLLQEGDVAVDATAGNGHDTLYLAQKVGERGHVYAFDVQQAALDSTKERLAENGIPDERVTLILSGHERMADYVKEPVRCVLFNLGWLPSGDHSVTTRVPTTLAAVEAACGLLLPGEWCRSASTPGTRRDARAAGAGRGAGGAGHSGNTTCCTEILEPAGERAADVSHRGRSPSSPPPLAAGLQGGTSLRPASCGHRSRIAEANSARKMGFFYAEFAPRGVHAAAAEQSQETCGFPDTFRVGLPGLSGCS